jgi:hypothetical protein
MHSVSRVFALLAVPAMAIACAPQDPAPPAVVVVRVLSADSTRPAQFKAWANGGELEIRTANSHLRGDGGARLGTTTPAEVTLHKGVASATFVSSGDSPELKFEAKAPEAILRATGRRIRFDRNASKTGVRVYPFAWPWQ